MSLGQQDGENVLAAGPTYSAVWAITVEAPVTFGHTMRFPSSAHDPPATTTRGDLQEDGTSESAFLNRRHWTAPDESLHFLPLLHRAGTPLKEGVPGMQ